MGEKKEGKRTTYMPMNSGKHGQFASWYLDSRTVRSKYVIKVAINIRKEHPGIS